MKRTRLGLSVRDGMVRGVLRHGDGELWRDQETSGLELGGLRVALRALLARCPQRRLQRVGVVVALGPASASFKPLDRFGPDADPHALNDALVANLDRFFLAGIRPVLVAPVRRVEERWWAWTVDAELAATVAEECQRAGMRLFALAPSVSLLGIVAEASEVLLSDGALQYKVTLNGREAVAMQPLRPRSSPSYADRHRVLDDPFIDARAAAAAPLRHTALWDPAASMRTRRHDAIRRTTLAAVAATALLAAYMGPGLRPLLEARYHPAPTAEQLSDGASASESLREHVGATAGIDSILAFARSRRSLLTLIADVSASLPASSAILSLRVDSKGASVVALTPSGISVLSALGELEGIAVPQLVGAVTRETIQGREMQRIAAVLPFESRAATARPSTMPMP